MAVFRFLSFVLAFLSLSIVDHALAQNVKDHVSIAEKPNWVYPVERQTGEFALADGLNVGWRIVSYQMKADPEDNQYYRHFAMELNTPAAVEEQGLISVKFDPAYQSIIFHELTIIRGTESQSILELDGFDLFRVETDRDKLIYNGDLQLNFAIRDLRVGDIVEYAYSINGQNPALKGTFFDSQSQEYTTPYQHLFNRVMVHKSLPVYRKNINNAVEGEESQIGDYRVFDVSIKDRKGSPLDGDMPDWHYSRPTMEISNAENWGEVGDLFAPYYRFESSIPQPVQKVINEIAELSDDPKIRARKALDYVQSNIRYLASEFGETGFIPRQPDVVLSRRFGDCKDVTFLLKVILQGLGIEAQPVLVDTDRRGGFVLSQPNHVAFDHILLRAVIDGEDYFMDATKDPQLGDIENYDQSSFQKGVLLHPNGSRLIVKNPTNYEWRKDIFYQFDISKDVSPVPFRTVETLYGGAADSSRSWLERDGISRFEKSYLNYYADRFPGIKQDKPFEISYDEEAAQMVIKTFFSVPKPWSLNESKTMNTFYVGPYDLAGDMPSFQGGDRTSPFKLTFPKKTRHVVEFLLDDDWDITTEDEAFETDALKFTREEFFEKNVYRETYSYIAKKDHISAEAFEETMSRIDDIRDDMGVTMQKPVPGAESDSNESNLPNWVLHMWLSLILLGFVFYVERFRRSLKERDEARQGWRKS